MLDPATSGPFPLLVSLEIISSLTIGRIGRRLGSEGSVFKSDWYQLVRTVTDILGRTSGHDGERKKAERTIRDY